MGARATVILRFGNKVSLIHIPMILFILFYTFIFFKQYTVMLSRLSALLTVKGAVGALTAHGVPVKMQVRRAFFPPTPYDSTTKHKLGLGYMFSHGWECIPIFVITATTVVGILLKTIYAFRNKVDVVVWSHSSEHSISRTMNLRSPTVHKMITINQRYEPWPEMQDVLDKIREAERQEAE